MPSDSIVESIVSLAEQIDWPRLSPDIQGATRRHR